MKRLMRFAIRTDGTLVLGKLLAPGDFFVPGNLYEVRMLLDEPTIVDMGPSAISASLHPSPGAQWASDATSIITNGAHLLTPTELARRERGAPLPSKENNDG